ncbi:hypothetical protein RhiirA4_469716 [Rhizophagus irregularis]|uniref:Uncharacterized protein n=1 Tax=Rhizophagus irregularis TaxID=588596 RepID=A0A2I1H007_9GLOM|nr:hypothetical protein RhiirA4_469716 [Rhizophagus irregularis]
MDETMRNIRMKNEVLKNYIIEEERDKNYNKRIDMIDEILKENQNFIDILSTELEYLVSWVIRDSDFIGKNGTRFSAKFEKKDVLLGIDEKVRRCLENFMKNLSNRKRIDEDYYLEMLAIEKFLQDEDMKLDILGHSELENILEEKREMGKFLFVVKKIQRRGHINLLKELPTYEVLYKREVNEIINETCPRCNNEIEGWVHIWNAKEMKSR